MKKFKEKIQKEMCNYLDRFKDDITDQQRADAWMLFLNATAAFKEMCTIESIEKHNKS